MATPFASAFESLWQHHWHQVKREGGARVSNWRRHWHPVKRDGGGHVSPFGDDTADDDKENLHLLTPSVSVFRQSRNFHHSQSTTHP